jgi:phage terminase small subunit
MPKTKKDFPTPRQPNKPTKILSVQQQTFCDEYLTNGRNQALAATAAGYTGTATASNLLKNPKVVAYLEKKINRLNQKVDLTFEYKIAKLKLIIDKLVPDDLDFIAPKKASAAVRAIAEANKMQGDIAAEKRSLGVVVDISKDPHLQEVQRIQVEIVEQYKREY